MFSKENRRRIFRQRTFSTFRNLSKEGTEKSGKLFGRVNRLNSKRHAAGFAGSFFFYFITFAVILSATDFVDASKALNATNIKKRSIPSKEMEPHGQSFGDEDRDIWMIPKNNPTNSHGHFQNNLESNQSDRRMDRIDEADEKILISSENSVKKENESVDVQYKTATNRSIGDLTHVMTMKSVFTVERPKTYETFDRQNARNGKNEYGPHEINDMMQKESETVKQNDDKIVRKTYKNRGSPFRLSSKGPDYHQSHSKPSYYLVNSNSIRNKKKPLTVLMDIYPVNHDFSDDPRSAEEVAKKTTQHKAGPLGNVIYIPVHTKNGLTDAMISRLISQRDKQNRLLLKLNLYPTGKPLRGKDYWDPKEEDEEDLGKETYLGIVRPGRRKSASLSRYKGTSRHRPKSKRCSTICRNPIGYPLRKLQKIRKNYSKGKTVLIPPKTRRPSFAK